MSLELPSLGSGEEKIKYALKPRKYVWASKSYYEPKIYLVTHHDNTFIFQINSFLR